jgi:hypothetical protein
MPQTLAFAAYLSSKPGAPGTEFDSETERETPDAGT